MANENFKSDIFKFVALRAPVSVAQATLLTKYTKDNRSFQNTPIGKLASISDGSRFTEQVKRFIEDKKYEAAYPESSGYLYFAQVFDYANSLTEQSFDFDTFKAQLEQILGKGLDDYLDDENTKDILFELWDRYYAFYSLSRLENINLDELSKAIRMLRLLEFVNRHIIDFKVLQELLKLKLVIPKILKSPLRVAQQQKSSVAQTDITEEKRLEYQNLWQQLIDNDTAIKEIDTVKLQNIIANTTDKIIKLNPDTGKDEERNYISSKYESRIDKRSWDGLSTPTKDLLTRLNFDETNIQKGNLLLALTGQYRKLLDVATQIKDTAFLSLRPEKGNLIQGINSIKNANPPLLTGLHPVGPLPVNSIRNYIKPLGIGDLKVVKQVLKRYVAGEVAHIENVLRGEYKERKHRVLDRTEDLIIITAETSEETTKDTQSTERFELKKESEKTIAEKMDVDAGITVSGSYGMVTFGSHANFAYSSSSTESNKSASNFAREVVDKSVSKIQSKTKEERSSKKLHEVEEINTHGIDNKEKSDHAVGIYRWVDKHYEAQIYNYGKRMMFEFIIPEPAAFYEYAQTHQSQTALIAPVIPYIDHGNPQFGQITHKNISEFNYQTYIRDYNVQGVSPAPTLGKTVTTSVVKDAMPLGGDRVENSFGPSFVLNNKDMIVPAGYISTQGVVWELSAIWTHRAMIEITIGNKIYRPLEILDPADDFFNERFTMSNNHDNADPYVFFWPETSIPISVNSYDVLSYTVNAYAYVERMPETYEKWQIETFGKIMTAYTILQADYDQKMAVRQAQTGIVVQGKNPLINREIEKTELKKHCIKMMMDNGQLSLFDAMHDDNLNPPDFDNLDALNEGMIIQYFEQAFEWENLTYLFYPYFWGRNSGWVNKSNIYDTDPLFTKFLQAGSARVVVPVKPAYNDAVVYYLQEGVVWPGGEPPILTDDGKVDSLFISIADELRNQTDDLAGAIPEGNPWDVVLPTTLVYLQESAELPTFD